MQNLKIYAQKTKNGKLDYYTNLCHKDMETQKMSFKKLRVGFKKEQETTGYITVKSSTLTFDKVKMPMDLKETNSDRRVNVEVPYTAYRLFIWEYEKTQEDKQKEAEDENNGVKFIKEYVSPEERQNRFNKNSNGYSQVAKSNESTQANEIEVQDDLEGLELPF